jgi:hypothetical protein
LTRIGCRGSGGTIRPGDRPAGSGGPAELTSNPGVIATTVLSGVIAVVVAAARQAWDEGRTMSIDAALALVLGRDRA